jgi:general secretion pathway protein G
MDKNKETVLKTARKAFTLVELLIVVAIIATLAAVMIPATVDHLKKADQTAAEVLVKNINAAVVTYYTNNRKLPSSLTQLVEGTDDNPPIVEGGEDVLLDPWNNELKFEVRGKRFTVISAGEDGEFGTEDDVRSDKKSKKN